MSHHESAPQMSLGQQKELHSAVLRQLPTTLTRDQAQYWIGNEQKLRTALQKVLGGTDPIRAKFTEFYRRYFNLPVDFSGVEIPADPGGFTRVLIVAQGLTPNQVYNVCTDHFPTWRYTNDLDAAIEHDDRDSADGSYAIRLRDRREADEEHKNRSATDLAEVNIPSITLTERLLLELVYYDETSEHLDRSTWTLCAGSRCADGNVPRVRWSAGRMRVCWDHTTSAGGHLRARQAVS